MTQEFRSNAHVRGTPNSGTTSLSALSTTAIKDGHKGHAPPHQHHHHRTASQDSTTSTNTLDAERADRISRLAGLERLGTNRGLSGAADHGSVAAGTGGLSFPPLGSSAANLQTHAHGMPKDRSTVGSASATGSVGGRTTWASGSDMAVDGDKMSEDGFSSVAGMSDEASLVGFGEAANSARTAVPQMGIAPASDRVRSIDGVANDREMLDGANTGGRLPLGAPTISQGSEMLVDEYLRPSADADRHM